MNLLAATSSLRMVKSFCACSTLMERLSVIARALPQGPWAKASRGAPYFLPEHGSFCTLKSQNELLSTAHAARLLNRAKVQTVLSRYN